MILLAAVPTVVLVLVACWFAQRGYIFGVVICVAIGIGGLFWSIRYGAAERDERTAQVICMSHRSYQGCDVVLGEMQRQDDEAAEQERRANEAWLRDYLKGKRR